MKSIYSYERAHQGDTYMCHWYRYDDISVDIDSVSACLWLAYVWDTVVMTKNKKRHQREIPAGKREERESVLECVKREVLEETWWVIISPKPRYAVNRVNLTTGYSWDWGVLYTWTREDIWWSYIDDAEDARLVPLDQVETLLEWQKNCVYTKKLIEMWYECVQEK